MSKLELYKNSKLITKYDGEISNNIFEYENISFNLGNYILKNNDKDYEYLLNFKENKGIIKLKKENYTLDINIYNVEIINNEKCLKIIYEIETEDNVINMLLIFY